MSLASALSVLARLTLRDRERGEASESSSPRKPEGPGGFPTEENCKASRPGVESSASDVRTPCWVRTSGAGTAGAAEGNHRADGEGERATDGPARILSESGARLGDLF